VLYKTGHGFAEFLPFTYNYYKHRKKRALLALIHPRDVVVFMSKPSGQIHPLTGIRGVAAFAVMVMHLYQGAKMNEAGLQLGPLLPFAHHGEMGVDLFFMLSGFVMSMVHQKDFVDLTWAQCKRYWQLRFARVYPLHAFLLVLFVVCLWFGGKAYTGASIGHFLASLLLIQIWTPTESMFNPPSWSVAAEALAYLWFPVTGYLTGKIKGLWPNLVLLLLWVVVFRLFYTLYPINQWLPPVYTNWLGPAEAFRIAEEFVIGCFLYNLYKQPGLLQPQRSDVQGIILLISIYGLMALNIPQAWLVAPLAMLILTLAKPGPVLNGLLGNKVAIYFGEISYALYLCHSFFVMALLLVLPKVPHTPWVLGGLTTGYFAGAWLFAHLLYAYVETPARKWLRQAWAKPTLPG
jgi:peptidoglycan/LPS O-acetylase OafA/YrhL